MIISVRGWLNVSPLSGRLSHHDRLMALLKANPEAYAAYFAPLGLTLVRHPREFFYFEPDAGESVSDVLPRIAVFSFILIDHAANQGRPIEEFLLSQHFLISKLVNHRDMSIKVQ